MTSPRNKWGRRLGDIDVPLLNFRLNTTHLSPGVFLIFDLAHDSGVLQSELFTKVNLPRCVAIWKYPQTHRHDYNSAPRSRVLSFHWKQLR